jgi:hypothetical protein
MLQGARRVADAAFARLTPQALRRNIARLGDLSAGASKAAWWSPEGVASPARELADGNLIKTAATLSNGGAVGAQWPIEHSIDGAALIAADTLPDAAFLTFEVHDGSRWIPVTCNRKCQVEKDQRRIEWSFEPICTKAARIRMLPGGLASSIAEIEVYRHLPSSPYEWPARLTEKIGIKQEYLASTEEPSFESLALAGLPMRTTRFSLGLKDTVRESGITLDGTILDRETIEFRFGNEQFRLSDFPDTLQRVLIDGWRPGVILNGRIGELEVSQTAYAFPLEDELVKSGVFVRLSLRNLSERPKKSFIRTDIISKRPEVLPYQDGALMRGAAPVFLAISPSRIADSHNALCVDYDLAPAEACHVDYLYLPESHSPKMAVGALRALTFESALAKFRGYWDERLKSPTTIEVPEPRINRMVKAVLAQIFVNGDGDIMPYGSSPSMYEGDLFGVEESYPMLALSLFGFDREAERYLDGTYLRDSFLQKGDQYQSEDRHQQYRNGLLPHYAISAYRLNRDAPWIRKHLDRIKKCAEWTIAERRKTMELENGERPLHWGLLPKWAYGGDIFDSLCYPLYSNFCCWKGLVDTAWLLDELGEKEDARRYADEARDYRACIDRAIEGSYLKDRDPPFAPLRLYTDKPDESKDYYQLFAGTIFDVEAFAVGDKRARWFMNYLEDDNRTFCFLPRFRQIGSGALDAIYAKGYILTKLHEDAVQEFLLAFYAYLALNMERETFVSRESNILYSSDLQLGVTYNLPHGDALNTDPLVCASAVPLHWLRHMLVTEERDREGQYSGNLLLLAGVPRRWLLDGQTLRMTKMPTQFGPLSLEVASHAKTGRIEAKLTLPQRNPNKLVKLRLRHPEGLKLSSVTVNGKPWTQFESKGSWILLPSSPESCRIEARYHE